MVLSHEQCKCKTKHLDITSLTAYLLIIDNSLSQFWKSLGWIAVLVIAVVIAHCYERMCSQGRAVLGGRGLNIFLRKETRLRSFASSAWYLRTRRWHIPGCLISQRNAGKGSICALELWTITNGLLCDWNAWACLAVMFLVTHSLTQHWSSISWCSFKQMCVNDRMEIDLPFMMLWYKHKWWKCWCWLKRKAFENYQNL